MELVSEKGGGEGLQAASTPTPPGAGGREEPRNPEGAERRGRGCGEVEVTACDLHRMQSLRRTQRGGSELTGGGGVLLGRTARAGPSETRAAGRAAADRSPGSIGGGREATCRGAGACRKPHTCTAPAPCCGLSLAGPRWFLLPPDGQGGRPGHPHP